MRSKAADLKWKKVLRNFLVFSPSFLGGLIRGTDLGLEIADYKPERAELRPLRTDIIL